MAYNESFAEGMAIVDKINYTTVTNQSISSIGVNMANAERVAFLIETINVGAAGTIDARLQACPAAAFSSGVVNLTGTNITQMTTNNKTTLVEVRGDQLAQTGNTLQYVRLNITGGGNATTMYAIGLAKDVSQRPASQFNLNSTYVSQELASSI